MAATKLLDRMSKKTSKQNASGSRKKAGKTEELINQYEIIRGDIVKLRDDLQKGYDMARNMMDKKSLKKILKSR